ncbi:MAG: glutamate--tRNA ligase [Deltaproteobacteria bacterium]|nr:glutamate--tRNA ligase [Deltaproteobacteria bacterium]
MRVRTRFAPSPTGHLHIGNARTALFNWLFARRSNGDFILRIEDTDTERSLAEFERSHLADLKWLGLAWNEGPDTGGPKGPYRQSERLDTYLEYAQRLLTEGLAYRCYCTKERLEEVRKRQVAAGMPPRYDGRCRDIKSGSPAGVEPVLRFKVPERQIAFTDGVHGDVIFDSRSFGDFVIIGSDGVASYNFAVVIDDAMMEISHVIRGDDHISNTPRQILLFESLGFKTPSFSHLPLVLGGNRVPLSKRDSSFSVSALRAGGFLPSAIINTIARLGWSPGEGLTGLDELAGSFGIEKLSKSPSVFDMERLRFYNKTAISGADAGYLLNLIGLPADKEDMTAAVEAVKDNASTVVELKGLLSPFIGDVQYPEDALLVLNEPYAKEALKAFREEAENLDMLDDNAYKKIIEGVKKKTNESGKRLFLPIRLALTGERHGIELVNVLRLLGKEKVIERLKRFQP